MSHTPLSAFYDALTVHDWWYEFSDDPSVWRRGCKAQGELEAEARSSEAHKALYDAYRSHVFNKTGKPPRPANA